LGIMRHASEDSALGRNLVLAIEESESHLHPGAIHELRHVLDELSNRHQIVLTTHNPLFVDRSQLRSNIIVRDRKARPAQSISELRDVLGVRASDNLRHAELVLLVEGTDDRLALIPLLSHFSTKIRESLDSGTLALEALEGATNLSYKASLIRQALCAVHTFLDDDDAGRQGFERARVQGVIEDGEVNWSVCNGMTDAEVEDLYDPSVYRQMLQTIYRVSIEAPEFRSAKKWTVRMSATFRRQGKRWDERIESEVKARIAQIIANDPASGLLSSRRTAFDGLVRALELRIRELASGRK
jgi:putative ATP-dependent endonuclease of OLD family